MRKCQDEFLEREDAETRNDGELDNTGLGQRDGRHRVRRCALVGHILQGGHTTTDDTSALTSLAGLFAGTRTEHHQGSART